MSFESLTRDDLVNFELGTDIDIIGVYTQTRDFLNNEAERIRAFFEGRLNYVVAQEFKKLNQIYDLVVSTIDKISNNKQFFNLYKDWIILEDLEESLITLENLKNYKIWARSNKNINIYAGN